MTPKKALSFALGILAGLLAVAPSFVPVASDTVAGLPVYVPSFDYSIPLMINSYSWLFLLVASGFFGMYLLYTKIPLTFKFLSVYLFANCFISEVPYLSFNAYILVVGAMYCYLWSLKSDFSIILNFLSGAFLLELILTIAQLCGRDTMMNFGRPEKLFLGTIMQYMRFASFLAIMTPFLVLKNKWFLLPIAALCILSRSSSFALALITGIVAYIWLEKQTWRTAIVIIGIVCGASYLICDDSLYAELTWGRWTVWPEIVRSVVMDTKAHVGAPLSGPLDIKAIIFGRGLDTFLNLFPIYKHDPNPFPQAHNMFLQWWWEMGLVGAGALISYCIFLFKRLCDRKEFLVASGLMMIGVNAFFTFPDRQTQTILLLIMYLAYCTQRIFGLSAQGKGVAYAG